MSDLTDGRLEDILIAHIIPYIGDYKFRFVAAVNKSMYHAYITVFPSKETKFNDDTKEMADICVREFRYEKGFRKSMEMYNNKKYSRLVMRTEKEGRKITLLDQAQFCLRHYNFKDIALRAAGSEELVLLLKWLYWFCQSKSHCKRGFVCDWGDVLQVASVTSFLPTRSIYRGYGNYEPVWVRDSSNYAALQWAKEKTNIDICALIVKQRNRPVLEWYVRNGWQLSEHVCSDAAASGDIESIFWARSNGFPWDATTCSNAALNGHFEIVKWAHDNGCPLDAKTCSNAALSGSLEIVIWAYEKQCPWDATTCSNAALRGHFEIVKWARDNGCPWDVRTCSNAKKSKNWTIYRWARLRGCPTDKKNATR